MIPYHPCNLKGVLECLEQDKRLRDYHYQNQTDPPKDVPEAEWDERAKVWNDITDNWHPFLVLEICSPSKWSQVSPWLNISRELHQQLAQHQIEGPK